jgi:hypothetical protein
MCRHVCLLLYKAWKGLPRWGLRLSASAWLLEPFVEQLGRMVEVSLHAIAHKAYVAFLGLLRISEHRDRPFRLIVTAHFANA